MSHARPPFKLGFEQLQRRVIPFGVNFNVAAVQIANKAIDRQSLRHALREVTIANALNPAADYVFLRRHSQGL